MGYDKGLNASKKCRSRSSGRVSPSRVRGRVDRNHTRSRHDRSIRTSHPKMREVEENAYLVLRALSVIESRGSNGTLVRPGDSSGSPWEP